MTLPAVEPKTLISARHAQRAMHSDRGERCKADDRPQHSTGCMLPGHILESMPIPVYLQQSHETLYANFREGVMNLTGDWSRWRPKLRRSSGTP